MRGKLCEVRPPLFGIRLIPARAGKTATSAATARISSAHPRACGENAHPSRPRAPPPGSSPRVRGKRKPPRSRGRVGRLIPARAGKTVDRVHAGLQSRAHPRACGENNAGVSGNASILGSSPRVRGKWQRPRPVHLRGRLIPARAGKTSPPRTSWCSGTAHPRACGENPDRQCGTARSRGSSPRVRGKPDRLRALADDLRLIPARAGKTRCTHARVPPLRAHPRACGENAGGAHPRLGPGGSSPRVRGKLRPGAHRLRALGLIPARAGKTRCHRGCHLLLRAHPRACGENVVCSTTSFTFPGSSPRVRGKRTPRPSAPKPVGLIPARAGKTHLLLRFLWCLWAHPRACGENARTHTGADHAPGSSPRVRGKRADRCAGLARLGLIPARAGKTHEHGVAVVDDGAHPRACGENDAAPVRVRAMFGSSPRVRGKRPRRRARAQEDRLIPARAGKTRSVCAAARRERAHPRACGENVASASEWGGTTGSSPRVRGKPSMKSAAILAHWLIPARAGKTTAASSAVSSGGAHPRACGENVRWTSQADREGGSSPRVRGKLLLLRWGPRSRRLIPARAGKTRTGRRPRRRGPAHPRACGENHMAPSSAARSGGSSPRVRGKPLQHGRPPARGRLIPARAGKTGVRD